MAKQMLNEATFSSTSIDAFARGRPVTKTMTYGGTIARSILLLLVTLLFAGIGWRSAADVVTTSGLWFFLGYILLIALSLWAAANPRVAPIAGFFYGILMGLWIGSISRIYEAYYDGIVAQALLASVAAFAVTLLLYSSRAIRVTGKFVKVVLIAVLSIGLLYAMAWILSIFGLDLLFWTDPGNPVGIAISVVVVVVAALTLILDFAQIETGVRNGAPAAMEWYAAYGLLSSLVWLYIEVLYLLARIRASQA